MQRTGWPQLFVYTTLALSLSVFAARASSVSEMRNPDASRIVSIGGSVTEILYALGEGNRIVGVDTTSQFPPEAKTKPSVGYMRQLSAEGVLGLRPTLILALEGAGPPDTLAVLRAADVPMVTVSDAFTAHGILEKIDRIAHATGRDAAGACLHQRVSADLDALAQIRSPAGKRKRVMFVLSFINGRAMASGRGTAADGIIQMAGGVNAIDAYDGYKPLTDEAVVAAQPDVVLAMRGGPGDLSAKTISSHPAFSATPAARQQSFIVMDGLYLLGFGPRTARAARDLAATLYPDLQVAPLPSERTDAAEACRS
jgi:iron complex transport system substrate-binding protein